MGIDAVAVLEHHLDRERLLALPGILSDVARIPALRQLARWDPVGAPGTRCTWYDGKPPDPLWPEVGEPTLDGKGFLITFGPDSAQLSFACRWGIFGAASGLQALCIDACRELLPLLGGARSFISPDSWLPGLDDGATYSELEAAMREDFGPALRQPPPARDDVDGSEPERWWLVVERS